LVSYVPLAAGVSMMMEKNEGTLWLDRLQGKGHQMPLIAGIVIIAQFSLVGVPLLVGFSARLALWRVLASVAPLIAGAALLGNIGLLVGAVRSLNDLFISFDGDPSRVDTSGGIMAPNGVLVSERLLEWTVYAVLVFSITLFSLFPQVYLPWVENILLMFERIGG